MPVAPTRAARSRAASKVQLLDGVRVHPELEARCPAAAALAALSDRRAGRAGPAPSRPRCSRTQSRSGSNEQAIVRRSPGQRVQVVGVVAMRGHEGVVPVGDDGAVAVVDLEQAVARPIRPIDALDSPRPPGGEIGSSRPPRARPRRACRRRSCLWGGHDDQLPDGVRTSTTSRRSAGDSGAMILLIWRVALPAPRISICDVVRARRRTGRSRPPRDPERGASAMATTTRAIGARRRPDVR